MALLAMRSEDLPEMLSNARIFIDRGSPIFRVGIGSPMWIEGAEDGHSGNDQNSECCLDGYGEAKCLQRARTTASENFTFQSGYHAPAMKCEIGRAHV